MKQQIKLTESDVRCLVRNILDKHVPHASGLNEMVVYHGSKADFDQFSMAYIGSGVGAQEFGYGLYLTFDPDAAYGYGGMVYEVEIPDIANGNYIFYDRPIPQDTMEKIYSEILEVNRIEYPDEFEDEQSCQDFIQELRDVMPPKEGRYLMYNIGKYVYEKTQVPMIMRKCGISGFIYNNGKVDNVVMFDSRQMRIINKQRVGD